MADTGWINPGTIAEIGSGNSWSNTGNVVASDNAYATASATSTVYPKVLRVTNFSFSLPTQATITGVEVSTEIKCNVASSTKPSFASISVVYNAATIGSKTDQNNAFALSDEYRAYGSSSDLWSATITPAKVNDSSFGYQISITYVGGTGTTTISVDHMRMKVYYTCPAISILTTELDTFVSGSPYSDIVLVSACDISGFAFSLNTGSLPTGLALSTASGTITGTPTGIGKIFTVKCIDLYTSEYDTKELGIYSELTQTLTDAVSSVTETISKSVQSFDYSLANNNQAYILNLKTGYWTFQNNCPCTNAIYRPSTQQIIASRRDIGQITRLDYGSTFDNTNIDATIKTGDMNLGELDEIKAANAEASEAIKKLRALFMEVIGEGNLTLKVYSETNTSGTSFTITVPTKDNATLNVIRTALSRNLKGKYYAYEIANTSGDDFKIGEMRIKIMARKIK